LREARYQPSSRSDIPAYNRSAVAAPIPLSGAQAPQAGIPTLRSADRLPLMNANGEALLWCVGAHGGSGESTLAELGNGWRASGHAWPLSPHRGNVNVVLVAKTSANGLLAAQRAATQWAAGLVPDTNLLGLVLVTDAPGRLPKPLQQLAQLVGGGVPRTWTLPWVEDWRRGDPVARDIAPRQVKQLVEQLEELASPCHVHDYPKAEK
jgi:hypothetical protein